MERRSRELVETYQAIDDAGKVYTIQVFREIIHTTMLDGPTVRTAGMNLSRSTTTTTWSRPSTGW